MKTSLPCFTNCIAMEAKGLWAGCDFHITQISYKDILSILKEVKKETNIIALDVETYAAEDLVSTREVYTELRKKDFEAEGKKFGVGAKKTVNKEYDEILKEVALNPRLNTIRLVQINTGTEIIIVDLKYINNPEALYKILMKFSITGQNIKFDVESIKAKYPWFEPKELYDVMIGNKFYRASKIAGKFYNNLKEVIKHWMEVEIVKEHGGSNWSSIITGDMFKYSYYDVFYLIAITHKQINYINADSINLTLKKPYFDGLLKDRVAIIEMKFLYPFMETELKGIPINVNYLKQQKAELEKKVKKLRKPFTSINPNSPQQLQDFLFKQKIYVPSTGKPVLMKYREHKIIKQLLDYKKYNKRLQMVTDYIGKHMEEDQRIYVNFNSFEGMAGRMSARNPNSQQIPKALKNNFYAPVRGYKLCKADYPSLEARVAGCYTRDKRIIEIFSAPKTVSKYLRDMHYITAGAFYGKQPHEITEKQRDKSKPANFGLMFGMGIQLYIDYCYENFEIEIDEEESRRQHKVYFGLYPGIKKLHNTNGAVLNHHGVITCKTLLGRQVVTDMYTNAANYPIQGSAGDIFKLACILFYERVKQYKLQAWIVNYIHDEVIVEAKSAHMVKVKLLLKESMEAAINFTIRDFKTEVNVEEIKVAKLAA